MEPNTASGSDTGPDGPVLVTGAAGGAQGSTGRTVAELLLERGLPVRAFVHRDDKRADHLRSLGADVAVGDLREIESVLPAMRGVRSAYFTYPVTGAFLDATAAFAVAARENGVRRVVAVSQLAAGPDAPTPHMRRHWLAEQVMDWAGIGAVHLRAAVFFENLGVLARVGGGREIALPLGSRDTVLPLVAASDVARVAAGILTGSAPGPEAPPGPGTGAGTAHLLTGDVRTIGEAAAEFGALTGTEVTYTELDPAEWERRALEIYGDPVAVEHLSKLWEIFRLLGAGHDLFQVTDTIERIGGAPPVTLSAFTRSPQGGGG